MHVSASDDDEGSASELQKASDEFCATMEAVQTNVWSAWRFHMLTENLTKAHVQHAPGDVHAAWRDPMFAHALAISR